MILCWLSRTERHRTLLLSPFPRKYDCKGSLEVPTIFFPIHTHSGYLQIEVPKKDGERTAWQFIMYYTALFVYQLDFAVRKEHLKQNGGILIFAKWLFALIDSDDIALFSHDQEGPISRLGKVFS